MDRRRGDGVGGREDVTQVAAEPVKSGGLSWSTACATSTTDGPPNACLPLNIS